MGDFVYQGEHSITFDPDGLNINTWTDWNMAPKSRPFVAAPPIKEEYVDVPGADGALDYTDALTGKTRYGRRTGTWDFIIENGHQKWTDFYSKVMNTLHGKYFHNIRLDDDPDYVYRGRLTVSGQFGNKDYSGITIAYNLDPYKYPIGMTSSEVWKWNDLFGTTIYFGKFNVYCQKARNILNEDDTNKAAEFDATNALTVYELDKNFDDDYSRPDWGISSVNNLVDFSTLSRTEARIQCLVESDFDSNFCRPTYLATGQNPILLGPGDNNFYFVGNGIVTVSYEKGKTL